MCTIFILFSSFFFPSNPSVSVPADAHQISVILTVNKLLNLMSSVLFRFVYTGSHGIDSADMFLEKSNSLILHNY